MQFSKPNTPGSLSLLEGRAEGSSKASSVTSPALDVRLAHEIGFQFGHHNADDPDEDKEVHLQGRWVGGGGSPQTPGSPGLPTAPPPGSP